MMKVLIACEESQVVCKALRNKGIEAFSCDILECSGGHPEWHIQGDAVKALWEDEWDLVIAHPPCTRLANSGVSWIKKRDLWEELAHAIRFFRQFQDFHQITGVPVCIENPIPHKYARDGFTFYFDYCNGFEEQWIDGIGKYSQIIQPYQFGHPERKATCLWLYGLPLLEQTKDVKREMESLPKNIAQRLHYLPPSEDRAKLRSKTFPGIAEAIAEQYTNYLVEQLELFEQ
ncbi:MAG: hypothetical protein NXH86_04175 [Flavobacteriaceae bacterium]|nr:hypothetical protein [Flavobacteriaceae bacterium]